MLTGRPPVNTGRSAQAYHQLVNILKHYESLMSDGRELIGPSGIEPSIPEGIEAVVRRSLALQREARYRDGGEMLAALDGLLPELELMPTEHRSSETDTEQSAESTNDAPTSTVSSETGHSTTMRWQARARNPREAGGALSSFQKVLLLGAGALMIAAIIIGWVLGHLAGTTEPDDGAPALASSTPSPAKGSVNNGEAAHSVPAKSSLPTRPSESEEGEAPGKLVAHEPDGVSEPRAIADSGAAEPPPEQVNVKVELRNLPENATVTFAGDSVRQGWIVGQAGKGGRDGLVIDVADRLRRVRSGEVRRSPPRDPDREEFIRGPGRSKIKTSLPEF